MSSKSRLKSILQYLGMIALAAMLLWLSLKSIPEMEDESRADFIWKTWRGANKGYLMIMAILAIISHVFRAYRWKMLLKASGNEVGLGNSFLSLMIGYLVNLAVPRGGEISRCYNLFKLEKTPVETAFGTVVAERIVDVICLILLIAISFFVEWDKLIAFLNSLPISTGGGDLKWVFIACAGILLMVGIYLILRKNKKFKSIVLGFRNGLTAVFKLEQSFLFVFISVFIWLLYFLMSYFVLIAFPETEGLGFSAVLTLFAMGAIAMSAPLPGGAGSYHTIVPIGLVMLYHLPKGEAIAFVFIFHAWQTLIMIVGGVVSLLISYWLLRWKRIQK